MQNRGLLRDLTFVAAVMSNLGLHRAMAAHGIAVETTGVGDRYVLERMNAGRCSLGCEQSGHVIMSEFATSGDGVLTGLYLAAEMARTGKSLAELASVMTVFPQVLINVRGVERLPSGSRRSCGGSRLVTFIATCSRAVRIPADVESTCGAT